MPTQSGGMGLKVGKNERKKELLQQFKQRKESGGVYKITNTANGHYYITADMNMEGSKNRFQFAQGFDSGPMPSMREDWRQFGGGAFVFEVLEEIEMKDGQTLEEFKEDLKVLLELHREGLDPSKAYK